MQLYLIRHGQSYVNLKTWEHGNTDSSLTEKGVAEAQALAAWLPGNFAAVDIIYASTMVRAQETAGHVAQAYDMPIHSDDRLREIGNNRWDHSPLTGDDMPTSYGDYWSSERPFSPVTPSIDDGETFIHFRARVGLFIEEAVAKHRDQIVLVICHGGVVECAFDHIFNIGPWRRCEIWDHNTAITHFEYVEHPSRETWRLHYHNRTPHLRGMAIDPDLAEHGTPLQSNE